MTFHADATKPQRLAEKAQAVAIVPQPCAGDPVRGVDSLAGPGFLVLDSEQAEGSRSPRTMAESHIWSVTDVTEPR